MEVQLYALGKSLFRSLKVVVINMMMMMIINIIIIIITIRAVFI